MEGNLNALTTIFTEFYYWVTIVFMFFIHVGFCTYEVGVSRRRQTSISLMVRPARSLSQAFIDQSAPACGGLSKCTEAKNDAWFHSPSATQLQLKHGRRL